MDNFFSNFMTSSAPDHLSPSVRSVLLAIDDSHRMMALNDALVLSNPQWMMWSANSSDDAVQMLHAKRFDIALVQWTMLDAHTHQIDGLLTDIATLVCIAPGEESSLTTNGELPPFDILVMDPTGAWLLTAALQAESAHRRFLEKRALHRRLQHLALATQQARVVHWHRNIQSGRVEGNASTILGYHGNEGHSDVGRWRLDTHPDDLPLVQSAIEAHLQGKTLTYECEYRMRHRDGHWIWLLSRGNIVERDESGRAVALAGVFMDVTERHEAQEAAQAQHRLIKAISKAQAAFIGTTKTGIAFDGLLEDLLALTQSTFGFVGEALYDANQQPYLQVRACSDIAWDDATRRMFAQRHTQALEFRNLKTLFGAALTTMAPVIANRPATDPRSGGLPAGHPPLTAFLGIPIQFSGLLVGMVGLANRPAGYSEATLQFIQPLCQTIGQLVLAKRAQAEKAQAVNLLQTTLDSMSEGILTLDAQSGVTVYNQRLLDLLDLPAGLMTQGVTGEDIVRYQRARGDFVNGLEVTDPIAKAQLEKDNLMGLPPRYLRQTLSGKTLEIKTRNLPAGGLVRTFSDVTHFVQSQSALRESEQRFRSLTELSADWYWEQDAEFRFVRVDGDYKTSSVMRREDYVGRTRWESGLSGVSELEWDLHRKKLYAHEVFHNFEVQRQDPAGEIRWAAISGTPIFSPDGIFTGYRGVGTDITARKLAEIETNRLAFFDPLTGLPNRRLLLDRLNQALAHASRSQQIGALYFIDLDNFKDLNDTLGHDVGDQLLKQVAERLIHCVRQGDTVARLGGDEFVLMLERMGETLDEVLIDARDIGEKVLRVLNAAYRLVGREHYSTPSIGVALFNEQTRDVDELLKRADLAMYQAKAAGRNTLRFFDPEMQRSAALRAEMVQDLRDSQQNKELLLVYQGIVDVQGQLVGAEALLRWQHPMRGLVMPLDFIPLAEQTGLILGIGSWVIEAACTQLVAWANQAATAHMTLSVNVSARQFRQADFASQVLQIIVQTGARPDKLKIELTESMLLNDVEDIIEKMNILGDKGIGFSLDDFGTGYSSLSYLKRLPLTQLKIDKSFVRDILTDSNDAAISRTVIALASGLGLAVVAEGVESVGQLEFLQAHGCQMFQGYLFGKPGPARDLLHKQKT